MVESKEMFHEAVFVKANPFVKKYESIFTEEMFRDFMEAILHSCESTDICKSCKSGKFAPSHAKTAKKLFNAEVRAILVENEFNFILMKYQEEYTLGGFYKKYRKLLTPEMKAEVRTIILFHMEEDAIEECECCKHKLTLK